MLLVVVTLSMMTTPLLMQAIDRILARRYNAKDEDEETPYVEDDDPQVIIVGFGRFGQVIGRLLMANKMRITVLERDVSAVGVLRRYGYKVYYGDATELELLRAAGAEKAKSIVITCNEPEDTMEIVRLCQHFPNLSILARARGRVEAHELLQAGVKQFSRETFSSALELGRKALMELGMHPHQAFRAQQHFRRLDMRMLRELMPPHQGDVAQISRVKEARRELEELFHREMQKPPVRRLGRIRISGSITMSATRKRFIAGAVCPSCSAMDTLAVWREDQVEVVECVKCGHHQRQTDQQVENTFARKSR